MYVASFFELLNTINSYAWGPPTLLLVMGVGLYLTVGTKFYVFSQLKYAMGLLFSKTSKTNEQEPGEIPPRHALMTAMAATVGTGNIAGVAAAIAIGGPGSLFWMWMVALVGMTTKYAEAVCAIRFRSMNSEKKFIGGPMHYIKNGLGKHWHWLAVLFALFGSVASFGAGNMIQSNSLADSLDNTFGISPIIPAILLPIIIGLVIVGGVKSVAKWASALVPTMAVMYVAVGLLVLALNFDAIPAAFLTIITQAFTDTAAQGGFVGATLIITIQFGIARGVFSNESGLGSASIAHGSAETRYPVRQGSIAMLGTFIDTLVVCTITGLCIVTTGVLESGETGVDLTTLAFNQSFMILGIDGLEQYFIAFCLLIFGFTTIIGWSFYGESCFAFLFGDKSRFGFRIVYCLFVGLGPLVLLLEDEYLGAVNFLWVISDIFNALMAFPNLIALALLAPVIFRLTFSNDQGKSETDEYLKTLK